MPFLIEFHIEKGKAQMENLTFLMGELGSMICPLDMAFCFPKCFSSKIGAGRKDGSPLSMGSPWDCPYMDRLEVRIA